MKILLLLLLVALSAHAELPTVRIDELPQKGVVITAVEFTLAPKFVCEVFYWHPQDSNQDGQIESCRGLKYNPCNVNDGDTELIKYVMSGGSCDEPEPLDCSFSPQPAGCP